MLREGDVLAVSCRFKGVGGSVSDSIVATGSLYSSASSRFSGCSLLRRGISVDVKQRNGLSCLQCSCFSLATPASLSLSLSCSSNTLRLRGTLIALSRPTYSFLTSPHTVRLLGHARVASSTPSTFIRFTLPPSQLPTQEASHFLCASKHRQFGAVSALTPVEDIMRLGTIHHQYQPPYSLRTKPQLSRAPRAGRNCRTCPQSCSRGS